MSNNRKRVAKKGHHSTNFSQPDKEVPYENLERAIESFQKEHQVDLNEVLNALKKASCS